MSPTPTPTASGPPPSPSQTPTLTPTQTQTTTPTPTVTSTETPTPTPTPTGTPTSVSELEYIVYAENGDDQTSYTFSGVNYNGPGLIIVGVHGISDSSAGGRVLNGVTISGQNMTEVVKTSASNSTSPFWSVISGLYSFRMTGGTSADVVVSFNSGVNRCAISIYRLTGNTSDVVYSAGSSNPSGIGSSNSVTLNQITGRNHNIGIVTARSGTATVTWTNVNEDYDNQIAVETGRASGGSSLTTTSGTLSVDSSLSSSSVRSLVAATWN